MEKVKSQKGSFVRHFWTGRREAFMTGSPCKVLHSVQHFVFPAYWLTVNQRIKLGDHATVATEVTLKSLIACGHQNRTAGAQNKAHENEFDVSHINPVRLVFARLPQNFEPEFILIL